MQLESSENDDSLLATAMEFINRVEEINTINEALPISREAIGKVTNLLNLEEIELREISDFDETQIQTIVKAIEDEVSINKIAIEGEGKTAGAIVSRNEFVDIVIKSLEKEKGLIPALPKFNAKYDEIEDSPNYGKPLNQPNNEERIRIVIGNIIKRKLLEGKVTFPEDRGEYRVTMEDVFRGMDSRQTIDVDKRMRELQAKVDELMKPLPELGGEFYLSTEIDDAGNVLGVKEEIVEEEVDLGDDVEDLDLDLGSEGEFLDMSDVWDDDGSEAEEDVRKPDDFEDLDLDLGDDVAK